MRWKFWLIMVGVVVAGTMGFWVAVSGPQLEVVNLSQVKQFKISWWRWRMYAWKMGYTGQAVKKVRVVFTDERQAGYELRSGGELMETMGVERQGAIAEVKINYLTDQFDQLKDRPEWWETDVLAGICQAMGRPATSFEKCYKQVRQYQEWAKRWRWGRLVSQGLVPQTYAQSCSGTIKCGTTVFECKPCPDGDPCQSDQKCTFDGSECQCGEVCNLNSGNDLDCSSIGNENTCNNDSSPNRQCFTSCNPSPENYCTWGYSPWNPPPELPDPPEVCNVTAVDSVETDCSRYGLRGTYTEKGAITAQTYSCGPRAYNPAFSCGYWKGTWEGYFVPPEAGEYEFLVDTYPRAGMGIDLNGDGVMNGNCGQEQAIHIVGDQSYVADTQACGIKYRPEWLRRDLYFGVDKDPLCGAEGCNKYRPDDQSELWEGLHCGGFDNDDGWFGDVNEQFTPTGSSYPLVPGLSTPASLSSWDRYGGECIYNTPINNQIDYGMSGDGAIYGKDVTEARWGGRTRLWVRRNFPEVRAYKVSFWYGYHSTRNKVHSMEFYYRKVGQPDFIRALDQVDSACPFRPCDVCDSEPPESPTLTGPVNGYSVRGLTTSPELRWNYSGNWGLGCGTAVNNFEVCVADTAADASAFANCRYQKVVAGGAGGGNYSIPAGWFDVGDDGQSYYWAVMANNGTEYSPVVSRQFYAPVDVTVSVNQSTAECVTDGGALPVSWQSEMSSQPIGYDGVGANYSRGNTVGAGTLTTEHLLMPSHTNTVAEVVLPTGWLLCNHQSGISNMLISDATLDFRATVVAPAWYQVSGGDVGARGARIQEEIPADQVLLAPESGATSGVAIAGTEVEVRGALGGGSRAWAASGVTLPYSQSWYNYFLRTFDQAFESDKEREELLPAAFGEVADTVIAWEEHADEEESYVWVRDGNLVVNRRV